MLQAFPLARLEWYSYTNETVLFRSETIAMALCDFHPSSLPISNSLDRHSKTLHLNVTTEKWLMKSDRQIQKDIKIIVQPKTTSHIGASAMHRVVKLTGLISKYAEKYVTEKPHFRVHSVKAAADETEVRFLGRSIARYGHHRITELVNHITVQKLVSWMRSKKKFSMLSNALMLVINATWSILGFFEVESRLQII